MQSDLSNEIDRITRRLLHTSQHNKCVIFIAGRIQDDINELRRAAGLHEFGWGDSIPDEEVGRCTVHADHCVGQHTHSDPQARQELQVNTPNGELDGG